MRELLLETLFLVAYFSGARISVERWGNRPLIGYPVLLGFLVVLALGIGVAA